MITIAGRNAIQLAEQLQRMGIRYMIESTGDGFDWLLWSPLRELLERGKADTLTGAVIGVTQAVNARTSLVTEAIEIPRSGADGQHGHV